MIRPLSFTSALRSSLYYRMADRPADETSVVARFVGSGLRSADLTVALRADPVRACLSCRPPTPPQAAGRQPPAGLTAGRAVWWCTDVMDAPVYEVHRALVPPEHRGAWEGPVWGPAPKMAIAHFHPRSTDHRPVTEAALLLRRRPSARPVPRGRPVRAVRPHRLRQRHLQGQLRRAVRPAARPHRLLRARGERRRRLLAPLHRGSHPDVEPVREVGHGGARRRCDLAGFPLPTTRRGARADRARGLVGGSVVAVRGHGALLRPAGPVAGQRWRALATRPRCHAFKCGDQTSHPHWASWAPIGEALNFHQPAISAGSNLAETAED